MSRGPWRSSGSPHKQEQEVALCSDKASSNIHQEQLQQPEVSSTAKSLQVTGLSGLILWGLPVGCKCYTMGGLASVSCPFLLPSSGGCCQASSLSKAILLIYHSQTIERLYFGGAPKSLQIVTAAMKLKDLTPWKESYDQPRQHIKKQRHYFANKGPSSQSYGFSSGHVWM